MAFRKEKPKLSCKRRESTDLFNDEPTSSSPISASSRPTCTPVRTNYPSEDEESPYFPCSTQEMNEDVDVLWDWNSPQSKPKTSIRRKTRKFNLQNSPKVPLRKQPNNNEHIRQDFNKLQEELKALKAEIAKVDNESSLVLSPREEEAFKREDDNNHIDDYHDFDHNVIEHPPEIYEDNVRDGDPFDDDMDEKLILFSQQVEKNIFKPDTKSEGKNLHNVGIKRGFNNSTISNTMYTNDSSYLNSNSNKPRNNNQTNLHSVPKISVSNCDKRPTVATTGHVGLELKKKKETNNWQKLPIQNSFPQKVKNEQVANLQDSEVFDDSFDNVVSQMNDDDLDQMTQVVDIKLYKSSDNSLDTDKKSKGFPRSMSEEFALTETVKMTSGKVEWHRTQSFESYNAQLSREKLQEIEKKRLEAKAKRDAKKKHEIVPTIIEISDSPIKCSQDEIEKKRLQALEKLEAKRLQDIIEKKKQEALKRREESRKKKAANVKSSLSTRL